MPIDNLPFCPKNYSRSILSTKNGFWLSLLNWDENYKSVIHGHPEIAFVYVLKGQMKNVSFDNPPLKQANTTLLNPNQYFNSIGKKGSFDNTIHQLYSIEKSVSLHFYSDDARKGIVFDENGIPD